MPLERLAPDAILEQSGFTSGTLASIQDDPDAADANWLAVGTNNVTTIVRVSFPTASGSLNAGADLQEFRVQVRKTNHSTNPNARIDLYENGTLIRAGTSTAVATTTGVVLSLTWNANEVTNADNVECYVVGAVGGGAAANRASLEVGAIEWNADYTEQLTPHPLSGTSASTSTTTGDLTVTGVPNPLTGTSDASGTTTGDLIIPLAARRVRVTWFELRAAPIDESAPVNLDGTSAATSTTTGDLTVEAQPNPLAGSSDATSATTADLTVLGQPHPLSGTSASTSATTGDLVVPSTSVDLSGVSAATSTTTGDLTVVSAGAELAGSSDATSTTTGDLTVTGQPVPLSGTSAGTATTIGSLDVFGQPIVLSGVSAAVATTTGDLFVIESTALSGVSAASSTTTGSLFVFKPEPTLFGRSDARQTLTVSLERPTLTGQLGPAALNGSSDGRDTIQGKDGKTIITVRGT